MTFFSQFNCCKKGRKQSFISGFNIVYLLLPTNLNTPAVNQPITMYYVLGNFIFRYFCKNTILVLLFSLFFLFQFKFVFRMHESQRLMKKHFVLNSVQARGKVEEKYFLFLRSKHKIKEFMKYMPYTLQDIRRKK